MANAIRFLAIDGVQKANSGHPGMPMGMADVATVLFSRFLRFSPSNPEWASRDRFVLSGGHGSMLLYALNYLTGYEKMTLDNLKSFRQLGSLCAGHPERDIQAGIETTTGPLGQGIANAVGMAIAERHLNAQKGDAAISNYTYCFCGDGDLMEGISHEACSLAGHLKLAKLVLFYDSNDITIDGSLDLSCSDDAQKRFEAYQWHVQQVDGHNPDEIAAAIMAAQNEKDKPSIIICRTVIGFGSPNKAGSHEVHGAPLGPEEVQETRHALKWSSEPFAVPTDILEAWRQVGQKGDMAFQDWKSKQANDFSLTADVPEAFFAALTEFKKKIIAEKPKLATRQASGKVLGSILPVLPCLLGGSADLTPSNNTLAADIKNLNADNYAGRYIRYGIRELGMSAVMNGLALYGGVVPYAGTFMCFTDYARPAMRLSALMKNRVVYVMTHDSIGLGEDGPTHQPVEHLAALRAIPNLLVFRPCDAVETAEAWELAVTNDNAPSVLALTRQGLPTVRSDVAENKTAKGGYVLIECETAQVTLMASGSEVEIILDAHKQLKEKGIDSRVVSMPCMELFDLQSQDYRNTVLGTVPRISVEAGVAQPWYKYLNNNDIFVGMTGFGESAPYKDLYEHFGITAVNIIDIINKSVLP